MYKIYPNISAIMNTSVISKYCYMQSNSDDSLGTVQIKPKAWVDQGWIYIPFYGLTLKLNLDLLFEECALFLLKHSSQSCGLLGIG